ncbi:hypothetical protein AB0M50_50735 [Nonomuraea fuscirosea]|jgi:hypothetical protein|nr:hypothetical protein [Nonomuraea fuscirosea]WSA55278.1 hypothetical protein OIE67_11930 [Nonomuraea fuscirosea]
MSKRAAAAFPAPFLILFAVIIVPLMVVLSGAPQRFWRAGLTEGSVRE